MAPSARERRSSDRHRGPQGRETAYRRLRKSAGTAWNAGLRPAPRGSAKPAPMTLRHANVSAAPVPAPDAAPAHRSPYPGPCLFHDGRGVQEDPIMRVSPGGAGHSPPKAGGRCSAAVTGGADPAKDHPSDSQTAGSRHPCSGRSAPRGPLGPRCRAEERHVLANRWVQTRPRRSAKRRAARASSRLAVGVPSRPRAFSRLALRPLAPLCGAVPV